MAYGFWNRGLMSEGQWKGETAICVASGPSLTEADCDLAQGSGHRVIAVNSSWQRVPQCDALYAGDYVWWHRYAAKLDIAAERWTNNQKATKEFGCRFFRFGIGLNSGLAAIHLAAWFGAQRILLLGYDCQPTGGALHWHGAHVKLRNPNDFSFRTWQKQFQRTPRALRERVVNCSRATALKGYLRLSLEVALKEELSACSGLSR